MSVEESDVIFDFGRCEVFSLLLRYASTFSATHEDLQAVPNNTGKII